MSDKGKQKDEKSILPESWTKHFESQLETVIPEARVRKKIKQQEKGRNLRSSVITESERINIPEGGFKRKNSMANIVKCFPRLDDLVRFNPFANMEDRFKSFGLFPLFNKIETETIA